MVRDHAGLVEGSSNCSCSALALSALPYFRFHRRAGLRHLRVRHLAAAVAAVAVTVIVTVAVVVIGTFGPAKCNW